MISSRSFASCRPLHKSHSESPGHRRRACHVALDRPRAPQHAAALREDDTTHRGFPRCARQRPIAVAMLDRTVSTLIPSSTATSRRARNTPHASNLASYCHPSNPRRCPSTAPQPFVCPQPSNPCHDPSHHQEPPRTTPRATLRHVLARLVIRRPCRRAPPRSHRALASRPSSSSSGSSIPSHASLTPSRRRNPTRRTPPRRRQLPPTS
jgi:hypothetical protein